MTIEEMNAAIELFIEEWWGTAKGESIYRKRCNTRDDDYDAIKDIYDEISDYV